MSEEKEIRPEAVGLAAGGDTKEREDAEEAKEEAREKDTGEDPAYMPNIIPQTGDEDE